MRARQPDHEGFVDRDGVAIYYEVYENDGPTLLFIAPTPITHSRFWKAQVPYLSRHFRVVTFDGRGNGRSGRPTDPAEHASDIVLGDIAAVVEESGIDEMVVIGHCHGSWWAVETTAVHLGRTRALIAIEPGVPLLGPSQPHWVETGNHWDEVLDDPTGWELNNRHAIITRHREWIEFFFGQQVVEPHSTKQYEDAVSWAMESTGDVLVAGEEGFEIGFPDASMVEQRCRTLGVPTLTIHGDLDICQRLERGMRFAEVTGGELVIIEGGGHLCLARDPVRVNLAIKDFVERVAA